MLSCPVLSCPVQFLLKAVAARDGGMGGWGGGSWGGGGRFLHWPMVLPQYVVAEASI